MTTGSSVTTRAVERSGWILVLLCAAQFMLVLDISVTNVALASIQADLDFEVGRLQWIVTSYTLVFGSLLIFFGRAGDLFGRRRVFTVGLVVFGAASLMCGLAQEPWQLIAARSAQGLGGAMMSPTALSLLTATFAEGPARSRALGVWGAIAAGGAAAGMIIGGVLTDLASWRWVFLINVPVAIATAAGVLAAVPESRGPRGVLDLPGAATITGGLTALVYGLSEISTRGVGSTTVLVSLTVAVLLLSAFVMLERKVRDPLVDFSLFASRSVTAANLFSVLSTAVVVGQSFFLSLYLRQVLAYSPLRTGLALIPITVTVMVVATQVPRLLPKMGVRAVLVGAGALLTVGMGLQSLMPVSGVYVRDVLPALVLTAAGLGFAFVGATIAATTGVRPEHLGVASGVLNTSQQVGGAVGLAVLATVAFSRTESRQATRPPLEALTEGFSLGFTVAAGLAVAASVLALVLLPGSAAEVSGRPAPPAPPPPPVPAPIGLASTSSTDPAPSSDLAVSTDPAPQWRNP